MDGIEKIIHQLTEGLMRQRDELEALKFAMKETDPVAYKTYERQLEKTAALDKEKYKNLEWFVAETLKAVKDQNKE